MANEIILKLDNILKRFPGVLALDNVNFTLYKGEIHALVGENGAGKSTLIKVITGYHEKNSGEIFVEGKLVKIQNPIDAIRNGIYAIYQESSLISDLSIMENIFIGKLKEKSNWFINKNILKNNALEILKKLDCDLDPYTKIKSLNSSQCKIIEIAKAISGNVRILILDEPTAALPKGEVEILFNLIRSLKDSGISIIYISHILDEIFNIAGRVTILRNGKNEGEVEAREENKNKIISLMVGRELKKLYPKIDIKVGRTILEVDSISKKGFYSNISFKVHRGEIIGFFGLVGAGHQKIIRTIIGDETYDSGKIILDGKKININTIISSKKYGFGLLPGDRKKEGLVLNHSVLNNISLGNISKFTRLGVINKKTEFKKANGFIKELNIKANNVFQNVETLSGGNQQKVIISRLLESGSEIFILENPTSGVDIGAKAEIYKILENLCLEGKSIIILSEDIMEIISICDRIVVIRNGEIKGILKTNEITKEDVLSLAL